MRAFACVLAASFALAGAAAHAAPKRVASLNLCTDELLLMLAAPEQIVSVTHLSQQQAETTLWRQARRYRKNDGTLVSVATLRPDLILSMGGGGRDRSRIARRLGVTTLDLPFPQSLGDIENSIGKVAEAVGRQGAGTELLRRLRALRSTAPARRFDTIWLGGGGRSVSDSGLAAQWMALSGMRQRPLRGDRVSLEHLLVRPPRILLRSDYRSGQYSGEQRWLSHPLARGTGKSRTLVSDGRPWTCMGPAMIAEIARLRGKIGP
jgi:iron complex transport system substrate-binding protein